MSYKRILIAVIMIIFFVHPSDLLEKPYKANEQSLYVELILVVDNEVYKYYDKKVDRVQKLCKDAVNIVNSKFNEVNVFVVLTDLLVWTDRNAIELPNRASTLKQNFRNYRNNVLRNTYPHDVAQLITKARFLSHTFVHRGNLCVKIESCSSLISHYDGDSAQTIAEGIAGNIRTSFNMYQGMYFPTDWDKVDFDQFNNFKGGNIECLKNIPQKLFQSPTCGNAFLEDGEECECGLPSVCNDTSCDPHTCRQKRWQCDDGQSIKESDLCNGVQDCKDNSDEVFTHCFRRTCAEDLYRCNYGGCIPKQAECNGTKECFDGSDENTSKCPAKSTSTIRVCGFSGCIVKQV